MRHYELKEAVKDLFENYLDITEESDSGKVWHPVSISCCRALKLQPLGELLTRLRVLAGVK